MSIGTIDHPLLDNYSPVILLHMLGDRCLLEDLRVSAGTAHVMTTLMTNYKHFKPRQR